MPTIDPKQLSALLRTGMASNQAVTEVRLADGGLLRYRKDVSSSVAAQIEAVPAQGAPSVLVRVFRASTSRPPQYPAAAPFLADSPVTVSESDDGFVLAWEQVAEPDRALANLVDSSVRDGWIEDPKPAFQNFARSIGMQGRTLRRGGRQRVISAMTLPVRTVSCVEGSETPAQAGTPR